jgi:hypothetical protein
MILTWIDGSCGFSSNIYVFGGADTEEQSKTVEKYDAIIDIWVTLTFKIHNSLLF